MTHQLFNTTITLIPSSYAHSNRSTVYQQNPEEMQTGIPALVTTGKRGYIPINERVPIKRGDIIKDEKTNKQYTIVDIFPLMDLYKLELQEKHV